MRVLTVVCVLLALCSCGDWPPESESEPAPPMFEVSCDTETTAVICNGEDNVSKYASGDDSSVTCTWHCVDYDGQSDVYVSLTFWRWDGGCYALEGEHVSGGIC